MAFSGPCAPTTSPSAWSGIWFRTRAVTATGPTSATSTRRLPTYVGSGVAIRPCTTPSGRWCTDGTRSVRSTCERAILPPGTVFYEEPLSFDGMPGIGTAATQARLGHRSDWIRGALEATQGCDVVFADPDNGLESGTQRHHRKGPKFAYFDELAPYLQRGQSLIIYHHLHRSYPTGEQVRELLARLGERVGEGFALLYKRGSPRAFFVVPSMVHRRI